MEHFDFLVLGAGLSGVGAAVYYLKEYPGANRPNSGLRGSEKKLAVFEGRESIGGTWDLFRYPGIRSDSSMVTFAFSFKPWLDTANNIAAGSMIKDYIVATAEEFGVTSCIRTGYRARKMSWDSKSQLWTVTFEKNVNGSTVEVCVTAKFLQSCTGYYQYEEGYTPSAGPWSTIAADFKGDIIHPQKWPEGYNYDGKRVVVIGSGATAVTLVPAMAKRAHHVTMLQRSPTWMISLPTSAVIPFFLRWLPPYYCGRCMRIIDVFLGWAQFVACRAFPNFAGRLVQKALKKMEGLSDSDVKAHFTPKYKLWDERFCVVANGDLFSELRNKKASIVTGTIERFVENGIMVTDASSGTSNLLEADVIVTATGLNVQLFGGATLEMDGVCVDPSEHIVYRGTMVSGIPNFAIAVGYTNASWTLKIELAYQFLMRMFRHMEKQGATVVTPTPKPSVQITDRGVFDLASGYVRRSKAQLPHQGSEAPWILLNSYPRDYLEMAHGRINDGTLVFQ